MTEPVSGPSRLGRKRHRTNLFESFADRGSDSEDDFEIPHVDLESDSSESDTDTRSSDSECEDSSAVGSRSRNQTDRPTNEWVEVTKETDFRPVYDINFTVREPLSARNIPEECKDPVDYFSLFIDDNFWGTLRRETNRYADQLLGSDEIKAWIQDHPKSRYTKWPEGGVEIKRLKQYVGLLLNMGLTHKKVRDSYWTTRKSQVTPYFGSIMPVDEFNIISRMLHLNNLETEIARGQEGYDPWCKVRVMLDTVNQKSKLHYIPSQNLSIDESMIGMKNRTVFIQYMPNKRHARFGLKKFELCDSNGYVNHLEIYAGKELDTRHDEGQAFGVVQRLMTQGHFLNKGYHLYTDNFYTKPKIAEYLYQNRTILTGTVRGNSKGLPQGINQKLGVGEAKFWRLFDTDMLALSFREKKSQNKPVLLISTNHDATLEEKIIRGKTKTKPSAIFDYNKFMGGVDISDKQICHYASERSTRRYWKKIFQNLLDISVLNSWIIFCLHSGRKMDRDKYLIEVVEALCEGHERVPTPQPVEQLPAQHCLVLLEGKKEKDCYVCSNRSKDKKSSRGRSRSRYWCPACQVGCHQKCAPQLEHVTNQGARKRPCRQ